MLKRMCALSSVILACSSSTPTPPARSATPSQESPAPRAGSDGPSGQKPANEFPAAIGKMMEDQPCQPHLLVPLDQHLLTTSDRGGARPFLVGVGERLCLVGDSPNALKLVDAVVPVSAQARKLISAELQVTDKGSVLVIRNHFDRALRYRAVIKVPNRQPQPTTVCPVRANIASVELWPHPVEAVAFGDFAPLEPGEPTDCR